jgi:hypothetical protein
MKTQTKTTKQMPILRAQRIVRRYLRYGVVLHSEKNPQIVAHATKQITRIEKLLDGALRRMAS